MKLNKVLFVVVVLSACLTQLASDIYAPSLLIIAKALKASVNDIQWSMSIYMLGVAISQLVYGPLSEGIGRKPCLIAGLIIMCIGSIMAGMAENVNTLLINRFIQGVGAGACASLWRAVFRDSFTGEELSKYSSYLVIFIMFIVPGAPLLGAYLEQTFGWRASFLFMIIYAFIALAGITLGFEETNKDVSRSRLKLSYIGSQYCSLVGSPIFMGTTIATFLSYGAFFSWFVSGPVILIEHMGVRPEMFGWFTFLGSGSAYAVAAYLNGKLVKRFGTSSMMRVGWAVMVLVGATLAAFELFMKQSVGVIMVSIMLFYFGSTFIWPNAFATAFGPFGHIAGYAGALYGFMQIAGAAVVAGIIAGLPSDSTALLGGVILICSICAWGVYEFSLNVSKRCARSI